MLRVLIFEFKNAFIRYTWSDSMWALPETCVHDKLIRLHTILCIFVSVSLMLPKDPRFRLICAICHVGMCIHLDLHIEVLYWSAAVFLSCALLAVR